jgi:hypothetical protein
VGYKLLILHALHAKGKYSLQCRRAKLGIVFQYLGLTPAIGKQTQYKLGGQSRAAYDGFAQEYVAAKFNVAWCGSFNIIVAAILHLCLQSIFPAGV